MGLFSRTVTKGKANISTLETTPAISLEKVRQRAPGLVDLYKTAGQTLGKHGLTGQRAAVYLVLDRSLSMQQHYATRGSGGDSDMQHLAEQALALSAHLDDDGIVPLIFFDHGAYPPVDLKLGRHRGQVAAQHRRLGAMGGTDYARAMRQVIKHYRGSAATDPAFVIFQTDGATQDEEAAKRELVTASKLPIFWQFIGFGRPSSPEFAFLRKLDRLRGRQVDNAGFFEAGAEPQLLSDTDLYDRLMAEFPTWLEEARVKGIVN